MPTPLEETRDALSTYICAEGTTPYAWAKHHGISTGTVYDVLRCRLVSDKRLNTIRPVLGLDLITRQRVTIDPDRQKVVNRQGPTKYKSRQVRLSETEAEAVDDWLFSRGWDSFSEWFRMTKLPAILDAP
jgi:hypothetical protein